MVETRLFEWNEDFEDLLDGLTPVERSSWRHGHRIALVFEHDNAHWMVWIDVHHEEGWQRSDNILATKVVPKEVTVTKWVPA